MNSTSSNKTYSIRISGYWNYRYDSPPELIKVYDVWCGERWVSGHARWQDAEHKIEILREYQRTG